MIVTDQVWEDSKGKLMKGYYMDSYLVENLSIVPRYLAKDFDLVLMVSGRGKVRTGKSTIAAQVGHFCAWAIAGGKMNLEKDDDGKYIKPDVLKSPDKPLNFNLENNLCFDPITLMKLGRTLPKNSVIIYDEGRTGLESKTVMTSLNKLAEDFFQECGQYNHVIIIVLPNAFKLHEELFCSRSNFLIDTYLSESFGRGYFCFFNAKQKEKLYNFGKKLLGVSAKYQAATPSFYGRFSNWYPFDRTEYERLKRKALRDKVLGTRETKIKERYAALVNIYKESNQLTTDQVALNLSEALFKKISPKIVEHALSDYYKYVEKHQEKGGVD